MIRTILLLFIALLFLTGCFEEKQYKKLTISTNAWIGYAPLFYADATGELKNLNIQLIHNVSLAEASEIFAVGKADLVTTTQHEYYYLKKSLHNIAPIILLDRSYGGDMILSNKTIKELQEASSIYTYLEVDSINTELLKAFMHHFHIKKEQLKIFNKDQLQIQYTSNDHNKAILLVTYSPYDVKLKQKGFFEITSTKTTSTLLVIDALCAKTSIISSHKEQLLKLKEIIDRYIDKIKTNPKASYKYVAPYLGNISLEEYLESLKLIKWINKPSPQLLKKLDTIGYPKEYLLP